ncbi:MAG: hypothetical protein V1678_04830 [Candidatus Aenigmatarchaeota archaeon]
MAMEVVKKEYEEIKRSIDGRIVIGVEKTKGDTRYIFSPNGLENLDSIKRVMTLEMYKGKGIPEIVYVGKVKLQETKNGLEPTLEDVDMSKTEIEQTPKLSEKANKILEEDIKAFLKNKSF